MTDYGSMLRALASAKVQFIIVGGAAAIAHGSARLTEDLDIVYSRRQDNIERLVDALRPLRPRLRGAPDKLPFSLDQETMSKGFNFTLATSAGSLDLFGEITLGGDFDQLLPYSIELDIFGIKCRCLGLRRLIEVKRAAARPKDLEAIAELGVILEEREAQN